jgi:hypothetical protein
MRMLFDTFQVIGLLWTAHHSWPALWLVATQWTLLFSGDLLSLLNYHSLLLNSVLPNLLVSTWQESKSSYVALYLPIVCIVIPLFLWSVRRWCCCCATSKRAALSSILRVAESVYLPVCLCTLELITCRGRVDQWWSYPAEALECWGWFGTATADAVWYSYIYVYAIPIVAILTSVSFLIWVPISLASHVSLMRVYKDAKKHEAYVNTKELEYLLYINTDYEDEYFDATSSYRRHAIHQRERMLGFKILLCLCRVALVGWNMPAWSMVVLGGILLLWAILQTLAPPYRVWSRYVIFVKYVFVCGMVEC